MYLYRVKKHHTHNTARTLSQAPAGEKDKGKSRKDKDSTEEPPLKVARTDSLDHRRAFDWMDSGLFPNWNAKQVTQVHLMVPSFLFKWDDGYDSGWSSRWIKLIAVKASKPSEAAALTRKADLEARLLLSVFSVFVSCKKNTTRTTLPAHCHRQRRNHTPPHRRHATSIPCHRTL